MPEKEIEVIDSQRLNLIQNCAYKYDLTFNQDLVPIEKAEPLERGGFLHDLIEFYYKARAKARQELIPLEKPKVIQQAIDNAEPKAVEMSIPIEEVDVTIRVFKEYVEHYWNEPHETLAVEQVGSKIMYEDAEFVLLYETKIDWIFRLKGVPVMPADHKHSKRRGPVHPLSNQFIGYCWMLNVHNIMVNKIGFQTSLKPSEKFERPIISYTRPVIDAWVQNTIWWVKMLRFHQKMKVWPQNFTSCDKYSGCIFQEVCHTTPDARVYKIHQLFKKADETWDIGAKL